MKQYVIVIAPKQMADTGFCMLIQSDTAEPESGAYEALQIPLAEKDEILAALKGDFPYITIIDRTNEHFNCAPSVDSVLDNDVRQFIFALTNIQRAIIMLAIRNANLAVYDETLRDMAMTTQVRGLFSQLCQNPIGGHILMLQPYQELMLGLLGWDEDEQDHLCS